MAKVRCRRTTAHAAHGTCPGLVVCAVCRRLAWVDDTVVVTEYKKANGKRRHTSCRF